MNAIISCRWILGALLVAVVVEGAQGEVFVLHSGGRVEGELLNPHQSPRRHYVLKTASGARVTIAVEDVARKLNGKGMTPEEIHQARGERRYKGRWRLPQEIELIQRKQRTQAAEQAWTIKIKMWRGWLGTDREPEARKNLLAIDDLHAVKALASGLKKEASPPLRALYVEVLAKIGTPEAIHTLATCSMEDPVEEVRLTCLDYLKKEKRPDVVACYVDKLKSKENRMVRRAAVGLGQMNDPTAIRPLIHALITTHKHKITTGGPGQINPGFGRGPGAPPGGLAVGRQTRIIEHRIANREVLDALVSLTGENFQYDVAAWRAWYASRRKHPAIDARRN